MNRNIATLIKLVVLIALVSSVLFSYVFLAHAAEPIVREQRVQFGFQGQWEEFVTTYTFGFDGSLNVENTKGFQFYFPQPRFQPADLPVVVSVTENSSHVIQHFFVNGTDKHGQAQTLDLRVYYDFDKIAKTPPYECGVKISLIGTTTDVDSEIEYEFENPKSSPMLNTTTSFRIGNIQFDWKDIVGVTPVEFDSTLNKLKIKFASSFNLDPSIVSSAPNFYATVYGCQRKVAFAQGRWWVFYSDGTNTAVRSSTDGGSWSSATTFGVAAQGDVFSIWQHDNYFDYVNDNGVNVQYRRGLFNSDGTITWSTAAQNVASTTGEFTCPVGVAVDSDSYPWIFYIGTYPRVTKSEFNNGTWSTAAGYPLTLNSTDPTGRWSGTVVPLSNGKMYVVYSASWLNNEPFFGKFYNGSAWGSEEQISVSDTYCFFTFSVGAIGNTVYFVHVNNDPYYVRFRVRNNITGWGSEQALTDCLSAYFSLSFTSTAIYLFHTPTSLDNINWRIYENNEWSTDSTVEGENIGSTTLYEATSMYELGFVYTTTVTPYEVKFCKIGVPPPPPTDDGGNFDFGGEHAEKEEKPPANETAAEPSPLPNLGLWGLIGAVGLIAVGGVLTATSSSSTGHSSYRRSSSPKTRYSRPPRPQKTRYSKVKG